MIKDDVARLEKILERDWFFSRRVGDDGEEWFIEAWHNYRWISTIASDLEAAYAQMCRLTGESE